MEKDTENTPHHHTVHHVLAHSYTFYFTLFIVGVLFDMFFPIDIFTNQHLLVQKIGLALLTVSSLLVFWAQRSSYDLQVENVTKETFMVGPYSFTRSPTHWGLFFLTLGFGLLTNSLLIVLFTIVSFIITKIIFLKKEENILIKKYGDAYIEYKKSVRI